MDDEISRKLVEVSALWGQTHTSIPAKDSANIHEVNLLDFNSNLKQIQPFRENPQVRSDSTLETDCVLGERGFTGREMRSKTVSAQSETKASATIFTPWHASTRSCFSTEPTVTSAPALRSISITITASIGSIPFATGINTWWWICEHEGNEFNQLYHKLSSLQWKKDE